MNKKWRWAAAQFAERKWWQNYLKGKDVPAYLTWKKAYWNDLLKICAQYFSIAPSDKISIRLHAQILSPIQWIGGGFYFGTGGGGASVSSGSTIWQFNLGGSVNYRIK